MLYDEESGRMKDGALENFTREWTALAAEVVWLHRNAAKSYLKMANRLLADLNEIAGKSILTSSIASGNLAFGG